MSDPIFGRYHLTSKRNDSFSTWLVALTQRARWVLVGLRRSSQNLRVITARTLLLLFYRISIRGQGMVTLYITCPAGTIIFSSLSNATASVSLLIEAMSVTVPFLSIA